MPAPFYAHSSCNRSHPTHSSLTQILLFYKDLAQKKSPFTLSPSCSKIPEQNHHFKSMTTTEKTNIIILKLHYIPPRQVKKYGSTLPTS